MRSIRTQEEYAIAQEELRALFNADSCHTDSKAAHELMRALDNYEAQMIKRRCTLEDSMSLTPRP